MTPDTYKQPCTDHIELRIKTETELATMHNEMRHHVDGLKEAKETMGECVEEVYKAVKLLSDGRVELARQDERLKSGNKRFNTHLTMILGLYASVGVVVSSIIGIGFLIISYHPSAMKIIQKLPLFG